MFSGYMGQYHNVPGMSGMHKYYTPTNYNYIKSIHSQPISQSQGGVGSGGIAGVGGVGIGVGNSNDEQTSGDNNNKKQSQGTLTVNNRTHFHFGNCMNIVITSEFMECFEVYSQIFQPKVNEIVFCFLFCFVCFKFNDWLRFV